MMATTTESRPKQTAPPPPAVKTDDWPPQLPAAPPAAAPQEGSSTQDTSSSTAGGGPHTAELTTAAAAAAGGATAVLDPTTSRRLLVILHGKRVDDELVREAIQELKEQGHQISVRVTFDRGDVEAFVSEAVRLNQQGTSNYQTIVAGGGDGTLNEVVAAMMAHREAIQQQGLAVALLPLGTANDFACVAGISVDPRAALRVALDPNAIKPIDVAAVNGQYFVNIAVAGSIAGVSPDELSSSWKRLLGPVAIGVHVLKRVFMPGTLEPHKGTIITFSPQPASATSPPPPAPAITAPAAAPASSSQQQQPSSSSGQGSGGNGASGSSNSGASPDENGSGTGDIQWLAWQATQSLTTGRPASMQEGSSGSDGGNGGPPGNATGASDGGRSSSKSLTADVLMLAAGNSRQMGRQVNVCPDALLDDGLLDFTLLTGGNMASEAAALLSALVSGGDRAATDRGIAQLKAGWLLVEAPTGTIPVNRDGEPEEASSRLLFEVLPKVLPMHLPDDRMLLAGQQGKKEGQSDAVQLQQACSTSTTGSFVDSSNSIRGNVYAAGEVRPALLPAGSSDDIAGNESERESSGKEGGSGSKGKPGKKHKRHKRLRKRTLQRMVFEIQQPEGWEVRQRQKLAALSRKLCAWGGMVLLAGAVGWAVRARQDRQQKQQKGLKQQAASSRAAAGVGGRDRRRRSKGAVAYGF